MTDHDWQTAYNAGKRDAERELVAVLTEIIEEVGDTWEWAGTDLLNRAETALEKHRHP